MTRKKKKKERKGKGRRERKKERRKKEEWTAKDHVTGIDETLHGIVEAAHLSSSPEF